MGLFRLVTWAVVGPLLLWAALLGHVILRLAWVDPSPLAVEAWPAGTPDVPKEDLVHERRVAIEAFRRVLAKGEPDTVRLFIEDNLADAFVWEDPMERLEGKEEFSDFMSLSKYVKDIEFEVSGEHHAVQETVMDWELKVFLSFLPDSPFVLPMRTHFVYAGSTLEDLKSPKSRRIVKIFEEWYGLTHMTRDNTQPSLLGHLHEKMRRFFGLGLCYMVRTGLV